VLAFAFAALVASAADAARQAVFPRPGWGAVVSASAAGLSAGVYAPALAVALLVAWPVRGLGEGGYLVDRRAYTRTEPRRGDLVWYEPAPGQVSRVGRVAATPGQVVEWSRGKLLVDGAEATVRSPFRSDLPPQEVAFRIPPGHLLIDPNGVSVSPERRSARGLALVRGGQVLGRPWARMYPLCRRRLLR
jgi:hypothetical protein